MKTREATPPVPAPAVRPSAWAAERPLLLLVGGYVACACVFAATVPRGRQVIEHPWIGITIAAAYLMIAVAVLLWRERRAGLSILERETRRRVARALRPLLPRWLTASLLAGPFLDAFGYVKSSIPRDWWDHELSRLDALLHGGSNPGDLLATVFASPASVRFLDWLYHPGWVFAFAFFALWFGVFERDPVWRLRVLLAYTLVWIVIGTVLAWTFASVGPCYFGILLGTPDPFARLMGGLHAMHADAPLISLTSQDLLLRGYLGETAPFGISAMPSVHVGLTTVIALALSRSRVLIAPAWLFLLLILAGSVRLGWHYAIDGYVAIVVAVLLWWVCGRLASGYARRLRRRRDDARYVLLARLG